MSYLTRISTFPYPPRPLPRHCAQARPLPPADADARVVAREAGQNLDALQTLMFRYSLDSSTEYFCGASVESQLRERHREMKTKTEDEIDFASALDRAMEGLATRGQFFECGPYIWPRGFQKAFQDCHVFVDKYVARRLDNGFTVTAEKQAFTEANEEKGRYIFLDALAEDFPDTVELRYQILGVLFAGRDITASLISWVFYDIFCRVWRDVE
ncbi:uncharacterized protein PpBr36_11438 [Pyricularia pennisetigena]|uniref:uncharacterized protein n=1 Tax=Pyricularia pennisetigena TaxID=1578925 RepID=UPI00114DFB90|nr:uncharacterized protein PpBr36_11438 [Pyricularia pennisetigena]TLS20302.1 hypothetical protein PpBr36_11438 [Pyricularia pennisetigena]